MSLTKAIKSITRISNIIFDNLLIILCVLGFVWQTIILLTEFRNGKTVTNISVGILHNQTLPAITVCPVGLDFRLMSKINPKLGQLYGEYLELIRNSNKITNKSLENEINKKYFRANDMFFDLIGDKPIGDSFANYTTQFTDKLIKVIFYRVVSSEEIASDLVRFNESSNDVFEMISEPMETIVIRKLRNDPHSSVKKCFTLFSQCLSGWSDITMDFRHILIKLSFDIQSYPHFSSNYYPIAMHSSNTIPPLTSDFKYLKFGSIYNLDYNRWKIKRLGNGYDTNCRHYEPKILTRRECTFNCYQDTMRKNHRTNGFIAVNLLMRKDYFKRNNNLHLSNASDNRENEILQLCKKRCPKECQLTYYSFTLNKYIDNDKPSMDVTIFVSHNEMPDLFIRHIPEMPLMPFICNFGGLLGMWLGASFLTILSYMWQLIHKHSIKIFNTNSFINNFSYQLFH